jgi:hypothetical protein
MKENTLQVLKACQKGMHMDCWEALYMQIFHQKNVLIYKQQVSNTNPLSELAKIPYTP